MFLIGEESLLLGRDGDAGRDPDTTIAIEGSGGRYSRRPRPHRLPATLQGARGLALLGLAVGASVLAALRPWGGGGPDRPAHTVSPRSPLISRSAAGAPAGHAVRAHHPAARPTEVHRPGVVHQQRRPSRQKAPASPRPKVAQTEPEREPTSQVAPVSSPAVTPTTDATRVPEHVPPPSADPMPPSPPPSSSGGGPGGVADPQSFRGDRGEDVDTFGFER